MLDKIDHIGVAVPDLDEAVRSYARLFGVEPSHREVIASDGVETVMFEVGESRIELLGAIGEGSKIAGFLAKRGGGIHHVAYGVADVGEALRRLDADGVELLDREPRPGAGGKLVAFVHPRAVGGVLTELCQPDPAARDGH